MSMEFGWWARDAEGRKYQVRATIFGNNITWTRKPGRCQPWESHGPPTNEEWDKLMAKAARRVPRRLISPKQLEAIQRLRRD